MQSISQNPYSQYPGPTMNTGAQTWNQSNQYSNQAYRPMDQSQFQPQRQATNYISSPFASVDPFLSLKDSLSQPVRPMQELSQRPEQAGLINTNEKAKASKNPFLD
ncbi:hypothetical protein RF11_05359 [Thelohanellus kitauei]|uniref:Uncharacterized protein n=1 Tax=Thelohanellus kitauei TaxID=669202 RepID=A0A0C2NHN3_THEKT|nr:hypothetical protein RF11_05359 [Thelohanellus kitauei]